MLRRSRATEKFNHTISIIFPISDIGTFSEIIAVYVPPVIAIFMYCLHCLSIYEHVGSSPLLVIASALLDWGMGKGGGRRRYDFNINLTLRY